MLKKLIKASGWTAIAVVATVLVAVVVASFGALPGYVLDHSSSASSLRGLDRVKAETDVRTALLQAVGGVLLVIGAVTAWRQVLVARGQQQVARRVATTDAFSKAVEQLGNTDSAALRVGGIYALDRITDDDPAERTRVAEILSAFIRERASSTPVSPDVAAALTVLARREWPCALDLAATCIAGARLPRAALGRAQLRGADLKGAELCGAVLRTSDLTDADLRNADLSGADLRAAQLSGAKFSGAIADRATRWPDGFVPDDNGVLVR
ncbi:pentapeptide repeat-containing protein [Saccharopolyspora sp. WRP15-2]|uniref:Pentapeptide repeat-containing protein n=1 Tax=Saccharopolyspora oryzae TaxID=2997343 RepID=A0ABT4V4T3_9PSEU|nr:pentapeptide repeat-containing protein [Saccharopolyspora oryzae]MDA3628969.1 pentapeptide repeat-containing protein [Saccharopolyspora oryzae]